MSDMSDDGEGTSEVKTYAKDKEYTIGKFFDLTLTVSADGDYIGEISGTAGLVPMSITIPEELRKSGRTFIILQNHDGKISEVGRGRGSSVDIKTSGFSTYAVAYSDSLDSIIAW